MSDGSGGHVDLEALANSDRNPDGSMKTAVAPTKSDDPVPAVNVRAGGDVCFPGDPTDGCEPGAGAASPGVPVVTLRDIASFRPVVPVDVLEPGVWGLVGRPVNFVSGAVEQVVPGMLLGRPAEVRFVPVGFGWGFGDGTADVFGEPGASWAQLGLREFAATGTSHVYSDRGTYQVSPSITYRAWYRFDGSGVGADRGHLDVPGTPRSILIGRIDTVLVAGDCHQYPDGPGC